MPALSSGDRGGPLVPLAWAAGVLVLLVLGVTLPRIGGLLLLVVLIVVATQPGVLATL